MSTTAHVEANRQNALLSTGPRTDDGKRISSENAVTHGLASRDPRRYLESAGPEALERWGGDFPARRSDHKQAVEIAAASEERLRLCRAQVSHLIISLTFRANHLWEDDRRAEVVQIAAGLARNPSKTVAKLAATRQGAEWLILRWTNVLRNLKPDEPLSGSIRTRCEDLLGVEKDLRNGHYSDAELLNKAVAALGRLRLALPALTELDALQREAAAAGVVDENNRDLRLIRRYEREAMRDHTRAVKELQGLATGGERAEIHRRVMQRIRNDGFGFVSSNLNSTPATPPPRPDSTSVPVSTTPLDDDLDDDCDDCDDVAERDACPATTAQTLKKPLTGRQRRHLAKMARERKKKAARQGKPQFELTAAI